MNRKSRMETAIGIFIVVGIACLAWLSMRLGKVEIGGGTGPPSRPSSPRWRGFGPDRRWSSRGSRWAPSSRST